MSHLPKNNINTMWNSLKEKEPYDKNIEYFIRNGGNKYIGWWDNEAKEFYMVEKDCSMAYFEKQEYADIEWWDESEEPNQNILWAEVGVIFETGLRIDAPRETADLLKSKYTLTRK